MIRITITPDGECEPLIVAQADNLIDAAGQAMKLAGVAAHGCEDTYLLYSVQIHSACQAWADEGRGYAKYLDVDAKKSFSVEVIDSNSKQHAISLAVDRYLKCSNHFNEVSREFTSVCKSLRNQLGSNAKHVVQVEGDFYIVTSDSHGSFSVEPAH